jgi:small basic protein
MGRNFKSTTLVAALLIGFVLGLVVGYERATNYSDFLDWLTAALDPKYPGYTGVRWGFFGAIIGAIIVYAVQLLRRQ